MKVGDKVKVIKTDYYHEELPIGYVGYITTLNNGLYYIDRDEIHKNKDELELIEEYRQFEITEDFMDDFEQYQLTESGQISAKIGELEAQIEILKKARNILTGSK